MTFRLTLVLLAMLFPAWPASPQSPAPTDLKTLIGQLGSLEYPVRTGAARQIRRAVEADAVAALTQAVRTHPDEFVRYRALVVLTSFSDRATAALIRDLIRDKNDRLRQVAFEWLEQHPDPQLADTLLSLLQTEQAEFVRPALIHAVAALGDNPLVQRALVAETGRGLDFFRGAVIDALGQHHGAYAFDAIAAVAQLDGPLQDDAILALARVGDTRASATLGRLTATGDVALTLRAARCMLGDDCDAHIKALTDAATAARASRGAVQAAVTGLVAIAAAGNEAGLQALLALAGRGGAVREEVAVGIAGVAVRRPPQMLSWLDAAPEATRTTMLALLKDGFDLLEEEFGEEQFFATARASYWKAPENSATRTVIARVIDTLEF